MIVEFVGLPGTGKTTLSRRVAEELRKKKLEVTNPTDKINSLPGFLRIFIKVAYMGSVLCFHPNMAMQLFLLVFKSKQNNLNNYFAIFVNLIFVFKVVVQAKKDRSIVLMDQGGIQAIWSLMYSAQLQDFSAIKKLLFPLTPDFLVHIVSNKKSITFRLQKRTNLQSRLESDIDKMEDFKTLEKYFDNIKELLVGKKITKTCILENSENDDLERNIETVVQIIIDMKR